MVLAPNTSAASEDKAEVEAASDAGADADRDAEPDAQSATKGSVQEAAATQPADSELPDPNDPQMFGVAVLQLLLDMSGNTFDVTPL